jgi:hypothetical protein
VATRTWRSNPGWSSGSKLWPITGSEIPSLYTQSGYPPRLAASVSRSRAVTGIPYLRPLSSILVDDMRLQDQAKGPYLMGTIPTARQESWLQIGENRVPFDLT